MARLEDVLPALREGKQIRRQGLKEDLYVQLNLLANDWEIVPEPVRVADYLVPQPAQYNISQNPPYYRQTHPIGQQPEGSVLVPGSERNQE